MPTEACTRPNRQPMRRLRRGPPAGANAGHGVATREVSDELCISRGRRATTLHLSLSSMTPAHAQARPRARRMPRRAARFKQKFCEQGALPQPLGVLLRLPGKPAAGRAHHDQVQANPCWNFSSMEFQYCKIGAVKLDRASSG